MYEDEFELTFQVPEEESAPEYIKKNSARFSFEEDENSRSYTEDLDEDGEKSAEDAEE